MYVVKIGHLYILCQKILDNMLFDALFHIFDFVVFYQPNSIRDTVWFKLYIRKK